MDKWIKIEDQLPKQLKDVLIYTKGELCHVCYYQESQDGKKFHHLDGYYTLEEVTHWMKFPIPPIDQSAKQK